ncbi:hypothetical protein SAMN02949497_0939 [Methylomagnum ishizawai]|uniref:PilZ domain-containing protein n=2 Tax=Methylomagnum ishizawai TaxID=1760988 RepID=A0A1Y6CZB9_9GAMM|nr:hypothetical protein SAMN02949497_0939 [Methylomagnum ishizawai]
MGGQQLGVMVPEPTLSAVSVWLAELPLANARYCFDAIEAALESFNHRPELPIWVRVELAELLRPTVLMLARQAEARFLDAALPYAAEAERYIHQGIGLHRELGMGYVLAAFDAVGVSRRGRAENAQALALYRALTHWGQVLLWTSRLYRPVDEAYWLILYRLFRVAEARRTLDLVFDEMDEPAPCRTAGGVFVRNVLFAAANTRRLRQRDMGLVFRLLGQWVDRVGFGTEVVRDGQLAEIYVDVGGALPPARTRLPNGFEVSEPRFLHTQPLANTLLEPEVVLGKSPHERAVLIRVARSLAGLEKRRYARRAESDRCGCVVGLSPLVAALGGRPDSGRDDSASPRAALELIREAWSPRVGGEAEARLSRSEVGLGKLLAKRRKGVAAISAADIWSVDQEPTATPEAAPAMVEGRIVNSSAQGCCIFWPAQAAARTKVGELIGLWLGTPERHLRFIAVIRWLECGKQGLTFGVELFAPSAEVVEIYDSASKPRGKALLLAADGVLRKTPELLALPGVARQGGTVRVRAGGELTRYWVSEEMEATLSFVRSGLVELDSEDENA